MCFCCNFLAYLAPLIRLKMSHPPVNAFVCSLKRVYYMPWQGNRLLGAFLIVSYAHYISSTLKH